MEEIFKSSPGLLKILQQEKNFEDLIKIRTSKQDNETPKNEKISSEKK